MVPISINGLLLLLALQVLLFILVYISEMMLSWCFVTDLNGWESAHLAYVTFNVKIKRNHCRTLCSMFAVAWKNAIKFPLIFNRRFLFSYLFITSKSMKAILARYKQNRDLVYLSVLISFLIFFFQIHFFPFVFLSPAYIFLSLVYRLFICVPHM